LRWKELEGKQDRPAACHGPSQPGSWQQSTRHAPGGCSKHRATQPPAPPTGRPQGWEGRAEEGAQGREEEGWAGHICREM